jgi:hypothetical protein
MLTPRKLITANAPAASAALYTAGTAVRARIDAFSVVNYSAGAVTFSVWLVPQGSAADNSTILIKDRSIATGSAARVLEAIGQWLEKGGAIWVSCSAAGALNVSASGIEQTTA